MRLLRSVDQILDARELSAAIWLSRACHDTARRIYETAQALPEIFAAAAGRAREAGFDV